MKLYEGAFLPSFQWPQPPPGGGEDTSEEEGLSRLQGSALSSSLQSQAGSWHPWSGACVILY